MVLVEKELSRKVSPSTAAVKRLPSVNGTVEFDPQQDSEGEDTAPVKRLAAVRKPSKSNRKSRGDLENERIRQAAQQPFGPVPEGVDFVVAMPRIDDGYSAKGLIPGPDGEPVKIHKDHLSSYGIYNSTWHTPSFHPFVDIDSLHYVLVDLATNPRVFIVHGLPVGTGPKGRCRRCKNAGVDLHHIKDRATRAVIIDADGVACDMAEFRRDPEKIVARVLERLGAPWNSASVSWHVSGSGGLSNVAKLHLAFVASRPVTIAEIRVLTVLANEVYGRDFDDLAAFDVRLADEIQQIYTADPLLFDGLKDFMAVRHGLLRGASDTLEVDGLLADAPKKAKPGSNRMRKWADAQVAKAAIRSQAAARTEARTGEIDLLIAARRIRKATPAELAQAPAPYVDYWRMHRGLLKLLEVRFGPDQIVPEGSHQRNLWAALFGMVSAAFAATRDDRPYYDVSMADYRKHIPSFSDDEWKASTSSIVKRLDMHFEGYVSDMDGHLSYCVLTPTHGWVRDFLNITDAEEVAVKEFRSETVARRLDRRAKGLVKSKEERAAALAERNAVVLRLKSEGKTAREIGAVVDLTAAVVHNLLSMLRKHGVAAESTSHISCRTTASLSSALSLRGDESTPPESSGVVYTGIYGVHPQREESVPHRALAGLGASLGAAKVAEDIPQAEDDADGAQDAFGWRLDPEEEDREEPGRGASP